jgi:hypothetical protein
MRAHCEILRAFRLTGALSLLISTALAAANPAPSTPQSKSDDAQVSARIQRVKNEIPPISLGADDPPLQPNLQN